MRHYDRTVRGQSGHCACCETGLVASTGTGGVDEPMMSAVPALGEHTEAIRAEFQR